MSKILFFSDLHSHTHKNSIQRLNDCLKALEWIFTTAISKEIDSIIFAGDLFQDRQRIHTISYEKTFNLIYEQMISHTNLSLYLLLGNHDMWYNERWDVSSISPLKAIPRVTIIDKITTLDIEGISIDFLPYTKNPIEDIKKFDTKSPVLVSHIAIDGAHLSLFQSKSEVSVEHDGDMVKVSVDQFSDWKKVFLGHYHCSQKLNSVVEYIGSPLELNFSEAFQQKHIILFDTVTLNCEYIINDFSPKHLIIKQSQLHKYNLDNNFVQIIVDDITSTNIIDMRKTIVKEHKTASLEFKEQKKKEIAEPKKEVIDFNQDSLEDYIKAVGHSDLEYEMLLNIGKEIIVEVSSNV